MEFSQHLRKASKRVCAWVVNKLYVRGRAWFPMKVFTPNTSITKQLCCHLNTASFVSDEETPRSTPSIFLHTISKIESFEGVLHSGTLSLRERYLALLDSSPGLTQELWIGLFDYRELWLEAFFKATALAFTCKRPGLAHCLTTFHIARARGSTPQSAPRLRE